VYAVATLFPLGKLYRQCEPLVSSQPLAVPETFHYSNYSRDELSAASELERVESVSNLPSQPRHIPRLVPTFFFVLNRGPVCDQLNRN
jgi:hypothetical protein